jgi:hypothetical protein
MIISSVQCIAHRALHPEDPVPEVDENIVRYICICRPSPSNQSFYRLIAGYQRGAGDHRVGH